MVGEARVVVLVEGESDRRALDTLARRRDRVLSEEGVALVAMGGATSIGHYVRRFGPAGRGLTLAGLYDEAEERVIRAALTRAGLEPHGFFVCRADLEDELIRALGPSAVEAVIDAMGDLGSWVTFQKQPAQRGRPVAAQLRRFMGTTSGRKAVYAESLVLALDLDRAPAPLDDLLAFV